MTQTRLALGSLAAAALCAIVFLAALHPATGTLGGLIYLLTAWALPTIFIAALALGLAWLIPASIGVRIPAAILFSFVLALNTDLAVVTDAMGYRQNFSFEMRRAVAWTGERSADAINVKRRPWEAVSTRPFGARVRVGSDEGCGCMYFLDAADALYSDRVAAALSAAAGRRATVADYASMTDPTIENRDAHIDLTFWNSDDGLRALIELFDRGEKIAAFAHSGIPARSVVDRAGVGREKITVNFLENALDILLHDNVWAHALNAVMPNYFPQAELAVFFRQASGKP